MDRFDFSDSNNEYDRKPAATLATALPSHCKERKPSVFPPITPSLFGFKPKNESFAKSAKMTKQSKYILAFRARLGSLLK